MLVHVLGGAAVDLLLVGLPALPAPDAHAGDEFTTRSLVHTLAPPVMTIGGNGANAAYGLCKLGCDVKLVTTLGEDWFGQAARDWLSAAGCEIVPIPPHATPVNVTATDRSGRRISFFYPVTPDTGAALDLVEQAEFKSGDHLLIAGYPHVADDALAHWARAARRAGTTVFLDIGPAPAGFSIERLAPLLPHLDVLFCNRAELAGIAPQTDPERLADELSATLGLGLVIKDGVKGAEFRTAAGSAWAPCFPTLTEASVGAGDVFNAGFIRAGFQDDLPTEERLRFAAATAALMLERGQGALGAPSYKDVAYFLSQHERHKEIKP